MIILFNFQASDYYDVVILWRYDTMWGKYLKISSSIFQFKEFLDGKIVKHLVTKLMQSGKTTKFGALVSFSSFSYFQALLKICINRSMKMHRRFSSNFLRALLYSSVKSKITSLTTT
jgi:hypothetical protein